MSAHVRTLGVLGGRWSHPAHIELFRSVCERTICLDFPPSKGNDNLLNYIERGFHFINNINIGDYREYDVILCESVFLPPPVFRKMFRGKSKLIGLFASPGIQKVMERKINPIVSYFAKKIIEEYDGFLAVSKMNKENLKRYGIDRPCEVVYPYVDSGKYNHLIRNKYKSSSKLIIAIGYPIEYKGIDFLIHVFDKVANELPELHLVIITKQLDRKYLEEVKNYHRIQIYSQLKERDFCRIIDNALMCVHFGRFDAFPVATLETMLAGVPTFVSELTGTKEVCLSVDKRFVLPFEIEKCVDRIKWFCQLEDNEKMKYSALFKESAKPFNKTEQLEYFKKRYFKLLNEVIPSSKRI